MIGRAVNGVKLSEKWWGQSQGLDVVMLPSVECGALLVMLKSP